MEALAIDLKTKGYYEFGNGNVLPAYIWTKQVEGATLTYDCTDKTDPVQQLRVYLNILILMVQLLLNWNRKGM